MSQPSAKGKEIKRRNHYFHSLNMPIYLFFYFIALVIAIKPAWSTLFPPLFMIVTFQSQASTPTTRQTSRAYPEVLVSSHKQSLQVQPQRLLGLGNLHHMALWMPLRDQWACGLSQYHLGAGIDHTISFFIPKIRVSRFSK